MMNKKIIDCQETEGIVHLHFPKEVKVAISYRSMDNQEGIIGRFQGKTITFTKPMIGRVLYYAESEDTLFIGAPRRITLTGSFNLRDLGGYVTSDGNIVKWGMLYRSDDLSSLTLEDVALIESMQLHSIIDFRSDEERIHRPNKQLPNVITYHLDPNAPVAALASGSLATDQEKVELLAEIAHSKEGAAYFAHKMDEMKDQMIALVKDPYCNERYRSFLHVILQGESAPVLFHCRGGKDRTGFGAALLLLALGVSKECVLQDYMLTGVYMKARNKLRMAQYAQYTKDPLVLDYLHSLMDTQRRYIEAALQTMEELDGSIEGYLQQTMQLRSEDIAQLQAMYLMKP